jgi:hypothetical protein
VRRSVLNFRSNRDDACRLSATETDCTPHDAANDVSSALWREFLVQKLPLSLPLFYFIGLGLKSTIDEEKTGITHAT